jgi:DNA-binding CsgD family transcriptional regulator
VNEPDNPYGLLPSQTRELYIRAIKREQIPPGTPGLQSAVALGVLIPDSRAAGTYEALEPSRITAALLGAAREQLAGINCFLGQLPGLREDLGTFYDDIRASSQEGAVEHLEGVDEINSRIAEIIAGAQKELITAQPGGGRTSETLARSTPRDTAALERGVMMRTLYHATARFSAPTQMWAEVMATRGGEVRTLDAPFMRLVIVDRAYAFIQDCLPSAPGEPDNRRAHLIRDRAVCAFLAEVFERDWSHADYWHGTPAVEGMATLTTAMQRSILRALSSGYTQEQAAKNLGLSTRTLQKHLAGLRQKVPHLQSIPQMTYWWAACPDRHVA